MPSLHELLYPDPAQVKALTVEEARRQGVNPQLALKVFQLESGFNPLATGPAHPRYGAARGVAQTIDRTGQSVGIRNPYDYRESVAGGIRYLRQLAQQFPGREDLQAAAYQAGPGAVRQAGNAIPQTRDANISTGEYVRRVLGMAASSVSPRRAEAATPRPQAAQSLYDTLYPDEAAPTAQGSQSLYETLYPEAPASQAPDSAVPVPDAPAARQAQDIAIMRRLGHDPAVIFQSKAYSPGMLAEFAEGLGTDEGGTIAGNLGRRAGYGLLAGMAGGAQLVQRGLRTLGVGSDADVALTDIKSTLLEEARQRTAEKSVPVAGFVAETLGQVANPASAIPALPVGGPLARGLAGGAVAGALQPVPDLRADESIAAPKAFQVGAGAALGGAGAAVASRGEQLLPGVRRARPVIQHAQAAEALQALPSRYGSEALPIVQQALQLPVPANVSAKALTGTPAQQLYGRLDAVAGETLVDVAPARAALATVRQELGDPGSALEPSAVHRILDSVEALGNTATVKDIQALLQDLGQSFRSTTGKVRYAAGQVADTLNDALEASVSLGGENATAIQLLKAARTAYKREGAVDTLTDALARGGSVIARNEQGEIAVNVKSALNLVDRLAKRDRFFRQSFSADERTALDAAMQEVKALPSATVKPPSTYRLLRDVAGGAAGGALLGSGPTGLAVGTGLAAADYGNYLAAHWLLDPSRRAMLTRLATRDGTVPFAVLQGITGTTGALVDQLHERTPAP